MANDLRKVFSSEALKLLAQYNLLRPLVTAEVISEELKEITIEKEISDNLWDSYLAKIGIQNDEQLNIHLQSQALDPISLRRQLELPSKVLSHSKATFAHKTEARFFEQKDKLDRVVYSLLRIKDRFIARELYLRIASQEANFADLAGSYSEGPEIKTKGIIGPVPLDQAHPILYKKLRNSQPGQLLEPFQIDNWWLVVRLERYEPAQFDESMSEILSQEFFKEMVEEKVNSQILELSTHAR